jgi:hypothetical protein
VVVVCQCEGGHKDNKDGLLLIDSTKLSLDESEDRALKAETIFTSNNGRPRRALGPCNYDDDRSREFDPLR